jgi:holliday junction DNA helicase RuvB
VIEPYLLQQGLVARTPRGRVVVKGGYLALGLSAPKSIETLPLLDDDNA